MLKRSSLHVSKGVPDTGTAFHEEAVDLRPEEKKRAPGIGEQDVLQPSVTNLTNRQIKRIPVAGWFVTRPRLDESRRHKPP